MVKATKPTMIVFLIILSVLLAFTFFLRNPDQYIHVTSVSSTSLKSLKEDVDDVDDVDGTSTNNNEEGSNSGNLSPHAYSMNGTSANYTWQGNTSVWIPPEGVPYLYQSDIRRIFRSENTIWIGDSTGRQDYQTMFSLMNGNGKNITDDNDNIIGLYRDAAFLNININKGKRHRGKIPSHCPARIIPEPEETNKMFADLGQVSGTDQNCSVATTEKQPILDGSPWSRFSMENQATGKFDLMYSMCFDKTKPKLKEKKEVLEREYSVMIFSLGIWEVVRPLDCRIPNVTAATVVVEVLENLRALSGPSLFVIWKTHGPHLNHSNTPTLGKGIISAIHTWFLEEQPPYMDLADFRWALRDRSFHPLRITGDLEPHWGLNARLLSIEMISHIVDAKQKRGT